MSAEAPTNPALPSEQPPAALLPAASPWRRVSAAIAARLVAAALLTAATAKVAAAGPFLREIESLIDIGRGMTIAAAVFILLIEFTVGTALLVGWRLRSTAGSAAGLLTFFLGVLIYRLATEGPVSCTCFGDWWVRSPPMALATDALLLAAAVFVFLSAPVPEPEPPRWATWAVSAVGVGSFTGSFALMLLTVPPEKLTVGEDVRRLDLPAAAAIAADDRLVAVIDVTCPRCQSQWPRLKAIAADGSLPPTDIYVTNLMDEVLGFRAKFHVPEDKFPLREIVGPARLRFLASKPPILMWVRKGRVLALWAHVVVLPSPDEVRAAIDRLR